MPESALAGLKIIDLTHYIAGPYCTKILAGLGAEVIKVEKPGDGDGARRTGPFANDEPHLEKSLLFLFLNTGKKGITLNLKSGEGAKILRELVKGADILVENFRPGVLDSWGLGYESLKEINPRLVMTSISNFGQIGPYRDFKAADIVEYAMSGLMYTTGAYDREPLKHGLSQSQIVGGANAVVGTLTALYFRQATGRGQQVDISLQEGLMGMQTSMLAAYGYNGGITRRQPRRGSGWGNIMPCKDGHLVPVSVNIDPDLLAAFLEAPELAEPKFRDTASRSANANEFDEKLKARFAERTKEELFHGSQIYRFAWAMVQNSQELADCPQLNTRGFFAELDHPVVGKAKYPSALVKMSESPMREDCPAPLLGQHNQEIYGERLGYSKEDMVRLTEQGVI